MPDERVERLLARIDEKLRCSSESLELQQQALQNRVRGVENQQVR